MRGKIAGLLALLGGVLHSCGPEAPPRPPRLLEAAEAVVPFADRAVDLRGPLEGFPFSQFYFSRDAGRIFYFSHDEHQTWKAVSFSRRVDLWRGETISDVDFSRRSVWSIAYHQGDGRLYWLGDEHNDEHINLWRLEPGVGKPEQLTNVPYVYSWSFAPDRRRLAYLARHDTGGALHLLDLHSGRDAVVATDRPELRFTYGRPSWRPDGRGLILTVLRRGDRRYGALLYVDLASGRQRLLTDTRRPALFPTASARWLSNDECLYRSNQNGYVNAYSYHFRTGRHRRLTQFTDDVGLLQLLSLDGAPHLLTVAGRPGDYELALTALPAGRIVWRQPLDGPLDLYHRQDNKLLVGRPAPDRPLRIDRLTITTRGARFRPFLSVPPRQRSQLVHADAERLQLPTFDVHPATGRRRTLHAYLYRPHQLLPPAQRLLLVEAFYGGGRRYRPDYQVAAAAGCYVLSPAPRGSAGFGHRFAALDDGDLGGDAILDLLYAARRVADSLGIPPARTGLFGSSHGGYAVLRALTCPDTINGRQAHYPWGFGIAHGAFSDLQRLYKHGKVRAWVRAEAGDPVIDADRLQRRSPYRHAARLEAPLLLTHGTKDRRTPIDDIRRFADTLRQLKRPVTLLELDEQGHAVKGLPAQLQQYRAWLVFLQKNVLENQRQAPDDPVPAAQ